MLARLKDAFEPGSLYVELQDHGLPEQPVLNGILVDLARELDLPLVATNDVHYAAARDAEAHLYLSCIKTGRSFEEAKERHHGSSEMYLKSPEEMAERSRRYPEAIADHARDRGEVLALKLKLGEPMLPNFKVPEGYDTEGYFRHVAREGLERALRGVRVGGQGVDHAAYLAAPRPRDQRHREDEVPRILPHRLGLHSLREGERHPGGPGPRLGRRIASSPTRCGSPTSIPSRTTSSSSAS